MATKDQAASASRAHPTPRPLAIGPKTAQPATSLSPRGRCFERASQAPIARVCGADTPFPLAMEKVYLPDELKCYDAIKRAVSF